MLIFNGKKYFVPFISGSGIGANATPEQVLPGVKFVGANQIVEEGAMPIIEVAAPSMTAAVEEGDIYVEACNDQAEGYSHGGKAYNNANIYLTVENGEVTTTCELSNGQNVSIKKSVGKGALPPPVLVFNPQTGVLRAIVSFEEGGTMGYIDYTSETRGTYDVSQHIDPSIIKGGETLFGKEGTMPNNGAKVLFLGRADDDDNWIRTQAITEGYHDGNGYAQIYTDEKEVTPDKTTQTIKPDVGMVLKQVTVNPIPDIYKDASNVNVTAADVLSGKVIIDKDGNEVVGTMPTVGIGKPVITTTAYDEDNEIAITAKTNQKQGYVTDTNQPIVETYATLTVDGNKVTMSCAGAKIERTVGASIETCNVYIDVIDTVGSIGVTATTFANGEISVVNIAAKTNGDQTLISNVVCGSVITLVCNNYFSVVWAHGHNQVKGTSSICLTAPRTSGDYTAEIIAYDD